MLKTQKDKKLENFFSSNNKTKKEKNIIVGLSGGVDSSLSAALLVERDWNVEGLTLWLMKGQGSCCSCLLYTSPSPRDMWTSRMPSSA